MLQYVKPAEALSSLVSPAATAAFVNDALASEFSGLLAWRDDLLEKHWLPLDAK